VGSSALDRLSHEFQKLKAGGAAAGNGGGQPGVGTGAGAGAGRLSNLWSRG
jgi:hypothetical protein